MFHESIIRDPLSYVNNNLLEIRDRVTYHEFMPRKKLPPEVLDYFKKQGAKGGKVGGAIRAARMTAEERSESARKAVQARWAQVRGTSDER